MKDKSEEAKKKASTSKKAKAAVEAGFTVVTVADDEIRSEKETLVSKRSRKVGVSRSVAAPTRQSPRGKKRSTDPASVDQAPKVTPVEH